MKRITIPLALIVVFAIWGETAEGQTKDPLVFPGISFTVETKMVKTSEGEKKVTYRAYMHIPYVANPVDKDYQSMNVSVPVEIDGKSVDAENAPIFIDIGVGGYMSVRNAGGNTGGPGDRRGGPPQSSNVSGRPDLALAAGYVIVSPGCRGRDNKAADGTYYGKAPAAIVDLKAAVRYIRHNKGVMPGNTDRIVSVGCSAGGALSALLGASGNSPLYESYLKEIGAAEAADHIYASACYSPITDLEHADGAYEWMFGTLPTQSGLVDQVLSKQLKASYAGYQQSLNLQGKNGFGILSAENYDKYLLQYYLVPSANKYLKELSDNARAAYLANNTWIKWTDHGAAFAFADYVMHIGRMKGLPAFDDFTMNQPEPALFGNTTTAARHFTSFSLQQSTGDMHAEIDSELKTIVNMMNAMYFIGQNNRDCAAAWWLRNGSSDNHTSQTVMVNLATSLENLGRKVNAWVFWDGGHCADDDPEGLIRWIGVVTGFTR
ncbi:MAG: alpha/beta hydrolase [Bacteroidales bacterium]|nr:alpha/beta hydrolase [Bacteroidales bacterium]